MSDVYFFKNKLDALLKENHELYQQAKLVDLFEILKKLVITVDEEIEQLKKRGKTPDF
ncbi:MAG: hypothetical protein L0Y74_00630 [candidate division Zixibacteria bacterium]|nr:hypothetical protein [candidate division Zixibacteria bacterium]